MDWLKDSMTNSSIMTWINMIDKDSNIIPLIMIIY